MRITDESGHLPSFRDLTAFANAPKEAGLARTVCQYCSGSHFIYQCRNFRSLTYLEKCDVVNRLSLCKLCLNPGHQTLKCSSGLICKKRACGSKMHNTTLHPPVSSKKKNESPRNVASSPEARNSAGEASCVKSLATSSKKFSTIDKRAGVYLDIVPVKVVTRDAVVMTYAC